MACTNGETMSFLDTLKKYMPLIDLAVNTGLLASGVGAPFEPLAAGVESALNPLLQSAGTAQTPSTVVMNLYAIIIGVLTVLKATPGLPAATLSAIDGYVTAAEAGTAAYIQAESGFSAANYQPVAPIQ